MKLKPEQLGNQLTSSLSQAYWLSGDEPLLLMEAQDLIRQSATAQGISERLVFHTDNTFSAEDLIQATQSMSLFGDRTLIELRITGKVSEVIRKTLAQIMDNPNPDQILLISSGKIEASAQKAKWFTLLEKNIQFVQFWPVPIEQLPRWIGQRAQLLNLNIAPDALQFIAEKVDGNLLAAKQELDKLALSTSNGNIELEQVISAIADSARWNVFDLADATVNGQSDRALRILSGLQGEGVEPTIVLWALTKDLRALITIKTQLQRGIAENQAFRSQQIWDKRKPKVQSALRRLDQPQLQNLLQNAGEIDRYIKGQDIGDVWASLTALIWSFSRSGDIF